MDLSLSDTRAYFLLMKTIMGRYGYYRNLESIMDFCAELCNVTLKDLQPKQLNYLRFHGQRVKDMRRYVSIEVKYTSSSEKYCHYRIRLQTSEFGVSIFLDPSSEGQRIFLPFRVCDMDTERIQVQFYRCHRKPCKGVPLYCRFRLVQSFGIGFDQIKVLYGYCVGLSIDADRFSIRMNYKIGNPFLFLRRYEQRKLNYFTKARYAYAFEDHLKLVNYVHKFTTTQACDPGQTELINQITDILLLEHLFQERLPIDDHNLCLKLVTKFIKEPPPPLNEFRNKLLAANIRTIKCKSETETDILKSVIETLPGKFEAENGLTF